MVDNKKNTILINFINNSFLSIFLKDDVTDITYNGKDLFVENSISGRSKAPINVSNDEVGDFLSHLANISGKNFNALNPILDISFLNYRLNALHPLIAKKANEGVYTFALRIYSREIRINRNSNVFCSDEVHDLLQRIIENKKSIVISGKTGVGKTEFQKYLVGYMPKSTKIILIEDLYETYIKELYPDLDISVWVSFDNQKDIESEYQKLIKAALRNNPDWLMIAEVRGKEAKELYNAFTTGHPFITTIHAKSAKLSIKRFAKMMGEDTHNNDILLDLAEYISFSIHLKKEQLDNGLTMRYIESIIENTVVNGKVAYKEIYNRESGFCIKNLSNKMKIKLGYKEQNNGKEKR